MIVIRIGQLADQLGVHRNTIRNWIRSGRLPARSMSGKRYLLTESDFTKICQEFGIDRSTLKLKHVPGAPHEPREGTSRRNVRHIDRHREGLWRPTWGEVCITCKLPSLPHFGGGRARSANCAHGGVGARRDLMASQWPGNAHWREMRKGLPAQRRNRLAHLPRAGLREGPRTRPAAQGRLGARTWETISEFQRRTSRAGR